MQFICPGRTLAIGEVESEFDMIFWEKSLLYFPDMFKYSYFSL